jgi:hypothetical protein
VAVRGCERGIATEAELFAEKEVPPRLAAPQAPAVGARFSGGLNGVDDAQVTGAPAEMTVERLGHGAAIGRAALLDERSGTHDNARNTEAALHTTFEDERLAEHAARLLRQSLHGDDVAAVDLFRLAQARERRVAVDHHEAAAARPFGRAAVLR